MACSSCANRRNLLNRTLSKLKPRQRVQEPVVTSSTVGSSVTMTPKGYVRKCKQCGTEGDPSPSPERASLNCECNN